MASRLLPLVLLTLAQVQSPASPQAQTGTELTITAGTPTRTVVLSLVDLRGLPRTTVRLPGSTATHEGVRVSELLARVGAPLGKTLTGPALLTIVRARGADGYAVAFSMAELDPALKANEVIVADRIDGQPIPSPQGPLRLIVPGDLRAARAVRMLVALDVVEVPR